MHSSVFVPRRGVDFGCGTGNEERSKPLQTHRPGQANAILASQRGGPRPRRQENDEADSLTGSSPSFEMDVLDKKKQKTTP